MPSKSNYVCVKCEREMMPERTGVTVEEHTDDGGPYKIWSADLYYCPKCGHQCLVGFADRPLAHHHQTAEYNTLRNVKVEFHIR